MLTWLIGTDGDWTLAIARIVLGVIFFAHGAQKMLGWFGGTGLQTTVRIFREHLHMPAPLAVLAVATEFLGGLGLIVGFLWYGDKKGHGIEYHILVLALAMLVIFKGAGALSLDQALSRHLGAQSGVALRIDPYAGVITQ